MARSRSLRLRTGLDGRAARSGARLRRRGHRRGSPQRYLALAEIVADGFSHQRLTAGIVERVSTSWKAMRDCRHRAQRRDIIRGAFRQHRAPRRAANSAAFWRAPRGPVPQGEATWTAPSLVRKPRDLEAMARARAYADRARQALAGVAPLRNPRRAGGHRRFCVERAYERYGSLTLAGRMSDVRISTVG